MVNCVNGGGGCKYVLVMILSSGRAKTKDTPNPNHPPSFEQLSSLPTNSTA
jgi:hypothetical protein